MIPAPSGLILLHKKTGLTSFEALGTIKMTLGTGKVGHTGTLDKFAEGLLVVLCGRALKLSKWFSGCDKQYTGTIHFGLETDTLDPEGKTVACAPLPSREAVENVLAQFTGAIMQAPPAYSAIHIDGKRASVLARSGQMPAMQKRPVHIHKLELRLWDPPFAQIFVHCSSGAYIRSLARDIALAAGSRAHLYALVRTKVAGFLLEDAFMGTGDWELGTGDLDSGKNFLPLRPINKTIISTLGLPWFEISPDDAEKIRHGRPLEPILDDKQLAAAGNASLDESAASFSAAVFSGDNLVAMVEKTGSKWKYGGLIS
ncbi:MAG: tRNA pseudouridine(55) synthase TruB [Treponema sp.]|nr:tRNA pseudouridine(55) synthase TruB [Treponema sp.]